MIRRPAAAGTFYPDDAGALARTVDRLLAAAGATETSPPKALIVPHAGYVFSGPIAATGYAALRGGRGVGRVVLLGPAHFVPLRGAAVASAEAWRTPLGDVRVDAELAAAAVAAGALRDDRPHEPEHALEVQLPFLLRILDPGFTIAPIAVGMTGAGEVADLLEAVWEPADLAIVSTDLSHYHDGATAKVLDRHTAEAVLARDPDAIGTEDACGVFALRGLVELARRRGLEVRLLDLRTSGDTAGDRRQVVGYGAFAVG